MARAKKTKSAKTASAAKGTGTPKTVEAYEAAVPEAAREHFARLRSIVGSAVPPSATETISYGIPAFADGGVLVWFAAFSNHCSLFPTASVIVAFKDELEGFTLSKGTIHFPLDKPLPAALIKKIVRLRVKEQKAARSAE